MRPRSKLESHLLQFFFSRAEPTHALNNSFSIPCVTLPTADVSSNPEWTVLEHHLGEALNWDEISPSHRSFQN